MKRTLIILLLCTWCIPALFSQAPTKRAPTSISLGTLGYNGAVGFNLDQLLIRQEKWNAGVRVGIPLYNVLNRLALPEKGGKGASLGLNFMYGRNKAHLDLAANFSIYQETHGSYSFRKNGFAKSIGAFVGFRYQRPEGGFFIKAGAAPTILFYAENNRSSQFLPLPLLDIGLTLRNGSKALATERSKRSKQKPEPVEFTPRLNLQTFLGIGLGRLGTRYYAVEFGQAGTTTSGYSSKSMKPSLAPSLWLEYQFRRHLGITGGIDFYTKNLSVNWYKSSDPRLTPYNTYAGGTMDLKMANLRVPVMFKYYFPGRLKAGLMAGPYLDMELSHKVEGAYKIRNMNGEQLFTVNNSNIDEFTYQNFAPVAVRIGLGAGLDLSYDLREKHQLSGRVTLGHDLTQTFNSPRGGIEWMNVQLGYGYRLK